MMLVQQQMSSRRGSNGAADAETTTIHIIRSVTRNLENADSRESNTDS